jgi:hypothetical protein
MKKITDLDVMRERHFIKTAHGRDINDLFNNVSL